MIGSRKVLRYTRVDTGDQIDTVGHLGQCGRHRRQPASVGEQRRQVLELDAGLGEVRHLAGRAQLDDGEVQALDALIRLYIGGSMWTELLGAYEKKADVVSDPEEKKRLYFGMEQVAVARFDRHRCSFSNTTPV